ncbi:MAG: MBL fold metallo-hydrolase [Euryarchaeota archaeon]|nr:MBL fold metallo-hydrolase [Euryarchaeota archaeon]|tara:strand:+ start:87 stop:905 length:819 start_codon:yes stop_codon:yes gene_type:complete
MIELEDFHEDILGKAMRGLGIGKNEMASRLNVEKSDIEKILAGGVNDWLISAIAKELDLDAEKLLRSARKEWCSALLAINGLKQFNLPFGEMLVNALVVWDEISKKAWLFDTGPMAEPILDFLNQESLTVDSIFLTHTHRDHIACLDELIKGTNNPSVYVHELEAFDGCESITEGFSYSCGTLSLNALHTHGHALGGMTYAIDGLERPIAIVGDAIFAGSMGGGMISYEDALRTNRGKIMTLPDDTILCPGHGPLTTVGEEKKNNPFFPEFC